jgi:streptogramin lyase
MLQVRLALLAVSIAALNACSAAGQTPMPSTAGQPPRSGTVPGIVQSGSGSQWITAYAANVCIDSLIKGPLNTVWFGDVCDGQTGKIDMSGRLTTYQVDSGPMTEGPDGNVWSIAGPASNYKIAKLTPTGSVTYFDVPCVAGALWNAIASGPDGNLWFTVRNQRIIARITTSGVSTCFPTTQAFTWGVTAGPDGNVWFTEPHAPALLGKITPSGKLTEYPDPDFCTNIIGAGDGYLYALSAKAIVRISPSDGSETVVAPQKNGGAWGFATSGVGANALLHYSSPDNHLITLHLASLKYDIDVLPTGQSQVRQVAFGPDGNLWYAADPGTFLSMVGIDVFRSMTVNPTTMTLTVGQMQTATASEQGRPNAVFTATSANPAVATVANGSGPGNFNVTGVGVGSTTVRIADAMHNWVDIAVTVH